MNILAIDTTGHLASCALIREESGQAYVAAEFTVNAQLTHSQTIMPMLHSMLTAAAFDKAKLDFIAVSGGPGSFTGLRIGAAAAKGLAVGLGIKIVPVSTLDALAYNVIIDETIIVPMMDARRNQVYAAIYSWENGSLQRKTDYLAEDVRVVFDLAAAQGKAAFFLGDGAALHSKAIAQYPQFSLAPQGFNLQRAALVGLLAAKNISCAVCPADFELFYIRKSQAERERDERL